MGCHKLHIKQNKALVKGALGLCVGFKKGCAGAYRYGFNGQEKVDEIAGKGNHNTAEFGELDTRLGRRWNLDPVDQISVSNYAVFSNNPIYNVDVLLDSPTVVNRVLGGLQMAGGAVEAVVGGVGGVLTAETGVGAAVGYGVMIHGADNASAGLIQMVTGEQQQTSTEQIISGGLQLAGVSEGNANFYAGWANAYMGVAGGSGNLIPMIDNTAVKSVGPLNSVINTENAVAKTGMTIKSAAPVVSVKRSGDIIAGTVTYSNGVVAEFMANVSVTGKQLNLTNIIFYQKGVLKNSDAVGQIDKLLRPTLPVMLKYANLLGFKQLRIQYQRAANSSSKTPGSIFDRVFNTK